MRNTAGILTALLVLPALADAPKPAAEPADVELLVAEDGGLTLTARKGQMVRIRLAGNATTGYEWVSVREGGRGKRTGGILQPLGEIRYAPHPAGERRAGVGGEFLAEYQAAKAGIARLSFAYRRPWEKKQEPLKTFTVRVNILPDVPGTPSRRP